MARSRTPTKESKGRAAGGKFVTDEILAERRAQKTRQEEFKPWDGQPPENAERWARTIRAIKNENES